MLTKADFCLGLTCSGWRDRVTEGGSCKGWGMKVEEIQTCGMKGIGVSSWEKVDVMSECVLCE